MKPNPQTDAFLLKPKDRRALKSIVESTDATTNERVLAWAKLRSWGHGREFACCRVSDLRRDRANVTVLPCFTKAEIPKVLRELVTATQQNCADELQISLSLVQAAVRQLVKVGLLTTPWVESRAFVTKYKLGVGFRACLAAKHVRAFRPSVQ